MRLAIVYDWLVAAGGAELVLSETLKAFPDAPVHALIDKMSDADRTRLGLPRARVTWLQGVPGIEKSYRNWLPVMPAAMRTLNLDGADVVLAISHAIALRAPVKPGQKLLCLSLTPMRYAWDLRQQYLREAGLEGGISGAAANMVLDSLRKSDLEASRRVDAFAAISKYIAARVQSSYGRDSDVIYPPVATEFFTAGASSRAQEPPYYVTASRFVPYKRVDLIVRAFAGDPKRRLVVIGDGPDAVKVRAAAGGARNITFVGQATHEELRDWLRGARAFVFAAEEDFGIAPIEAQACGVPVIAYGRGGALETVIAGSSGLFFNEQTEAAIQDAVVRFESASRDVGAACRASAERFTAGKFREGLKRWVLRRG